MSDPVNNPYSALQPFAIQADSVMISEPDFAFKAPAHFLGQIDPSDPQDPLLLQILPSMHEEMQSAGFASDPVADLDNNPTPGLIHKYHGRVLLIASPKCDIHCRYCFRRHFPYQEHANLRHWQTALDYIRTEPSIHEVILSGGDPMALNEQSLMQLIEQIELIEHVRTLRIHSRTPVVAPEKAPQSALLAWAQQTRLNTVLVIHSNHPNELSEQTHRLFEKYKQVGITLLNQSVLLKGINDDNEVLEQLSHKLFEQGVLPYYLNLLDRVQGAAHFEVEEKRAIAIHNQLKTRLAGYLVPKLVRDIADRGSKSTIA